MMARRRRVTTDVHYVRHMTPQIAVVTGASGHLGSRLVAALAARGLSVLAVSRSGAAPQAGEVATVAADLASDAAIDIIRAALPAGDLAMAVHAVGVPPAPGLTTVEPGLLADAVDVKAGGLLRLLRAVDGRLVAHSRIVALGGHLGIEPSEHVPLAGVANAALANLVRQLVGPLGRRGATVHLIAPGPFESPRTERLIASKASGEGISVELMREHMVADSPLGHLPTADDVATLILGLLDPVADLLTGSTLSVDGGVRRSIF